jgi:Mce-associated membrane protein
MTIRWPRIVLYGILPGLALLLALAAGYLKYVGSADQATQTAGDASIQAAKDTAVAMLSYRSDTVDQQLAAAEDRLTGSFQDSYSSLTRDVIIPGAHQQKISTVATVPAAASVSATENHAQVLLFIDQTVTVDGAAKANTDNATNKDKPEATKSIVLVTLDKVGDRWLVSDFQPK